MMMRIAQRRCIGLVQRVRAGQRLLCTNENKYAEELQAEQIKPESFYDEEGKKKRYFYHVDLQGRLFIEDVLPKNVATSLKSEKFLDFFWHMMRPNDLGLHEEYEYISPCGKEMNFIRPADTPIVFDRIDKLVDKDGQEKEFLVYAATHKEEFDPSLLVWEEDTDRLYHPVRTHRHLKGTKGLLRSHLALRLSQYFSFQDESDGILLEWRGKQHLVTKISSKDR